MRKLILLGLALCASAAQAQSLGGPAAAVSGTVLDLSGVAVRLFGIDAPEPAQGCSRGGVPWACGAAARDALAGLVAGQQVACELQGAGPDGVARATCRVGSIDLADAMIRTGLALADPDQTAAYLASADSISALGIGLWGSDFEPPADYRAAHPVVMHPALQQPVAVSAPGAGVAPSVFFRNCNEARAAGVAPIWRGQPGYRPDLDRDNDGIACEPLPRKRR